MDFEERLERAIQRGRKVGERESEDQAAKALSEEELRRLHSQYRLQLSEHIEQCLRNLPQHFPGFRFETIYGERGWGAACSRDDIRIVRQRRENDYSRIELTVRPVSEYFVVDLSAKATVRNKEIFRRNHFEPIQQFTPGPFIELIDRWVLEFAERFAASE